MYTPRRGLAMRPRRGNSETLLWWSSGLARSACHTSHARVRAPGAWRSVVLSTKTSYSLCSALIAGGALDCGLEHGFASCLERHRNHLRLERGQNLARSLILCWPQRACHFDGVAWLGKVGETLRGGFKASQSARTSCVWDRYIRKCPSLLKYKTCVWLNVLHEGVH